MSSLPWGELFGNIASPEHWIFYPTGPVTSWTTWVTAVPRCPVNEALDAGYCGA